MFFFLYFLFFFVIICCCLLVWFCLYWFSTCLFNFIYFDLILSSILEPSPPTNFTVRSVNVTSLFVSWGRPESLNGALVKYKLYYRQTVFNTSKDSLVYDGKDTKFVLTGLKKFTNYTLTLFAYNVRYGYRSTAVVATENTHPSGRLISSIYLFIYLLLSYLVLQYVHCMYVFILIYLFVYSILFIKLFSYLFIYLFIFVTPNIYLVIHLPVVIN